MSKRRKGRSSRKSSGKAKPRASTGTQLPVWKKCAFSLVFLAGVVAGLELILAVLGIQPRLFERDPYVGFSSQSPLFVADPEAPKSGRLVTAPNKRRTFNLQSFTREKPDNTYRIFAMGGSTTFGRPYMDTTSFSGWLRAMLPEADPSQSWEVINCGGVSYASYRVALLMEELIDYQPDLFLVYSGQNEFLEQRTYGEIKAMPRALRGVGMMLRKTRSYAAIRQLTDSATAEDASTVATNRSLLDQEVKAILDRSVGPEVYQRDDVWKQQVLDHYRYNLARMVDIAESAGARVIFVTPASNLRDFGPFKSDHQPGMTQAQMDSWQELAKAAGEREKARDWAGALQLLDRVVAMDQRHAALHYARGDVLYRLDRFDEARKSFELALEEDICPLRAFPSMLAILEDVAGQRQVPLVDYDALLRSKSANNIPGRDWFLDHVHPTIEGHRQLALALMETLTREKILNPAPAWNEAAAQTIKSRIEGSLTEEDHSRSLVRLAKVLAWAGKPIEAYRVATQAARRAPEDADAQFEAGKNAHVLGRYPEAQPLLEKALALRPTFVEAQAMLGNTYAGMGQLEKAVTHYQKALEMRPDYADLHASIAPFLHRLRRTPEALTHIRRALELDPQYAEAHATLGRILKDQGNLDLAMQHFSEALRYRPGLTTAMRGLAWLLAAHPDPKRQNPARAVELGKSLVEKSGYRSWDHLDTLAVAYASSGEFNQAVATAERAIQLAESQRRKEVTAMRDRLLLYKQRKAYRDPILIK